MKKIETRRIISQEITVPGSKSISHRMLICAALSNGCSVISNLLDSEDIQLTTACLSHMGAKITVLPDKRVQVRGFGNQVCAWDKPIYLGNSGTSMRLLAGIAALGKTPYILTGDKRMCERPMKELLDALNQIGIEAASPNKEGTPPVTICGSMKKPGSKVTLDCSKSSQYLSALLMAGALFDSGLDIDTGTTPVSFPYVKLTMDIMKQFGVTVSPSGSCQFHVPGGQQYQPGEYFVEPDLSNAGYFWAIGAVTGQMMDVKNISSKSLQGDLAQVEIFEQMGCTIDRSHDRIGVRGSCLCGIDVDMSDTPDAVPAIAVVASFAKGTTRIRNIGHLREKECDRIDAVVGQLVKMGISAKQGEDWIEVTGGSHQPARIETFNDHRIAMAFSIPGLLVEGIEIENEMCVAKSFPTYWDLFDHLKQAQV